MAVNLEDERAVILAVMTAVDDIDSRIRAIERKVGLEDGRPGNQRPMNTLKIIMAEARKRIAKDYKEEKEAR